MMLLRSCATYNLISLCLGMAAWFLPLLALAWKKQDTDRVCDLRISLASLFCCAVSLCGQTIETLLRVQRKDWSALMDTQGAKVLASLVLLAGTALFNVLLIKGRRYREKA